VLCKLKLNLYASAVEAKGRGESGVGLAGPLSSSDKVNEGSLSLLPSTGLKTTVRIDEEERIGEDSEHGLNAILDLLVTGDTRGVNVVYAGADLVRVAIMLESVQELHVALRRLDGDDISIETLDRREDVIEVGVAEVRVGLKLVADTSCRELKGVDGPLEVAVPVRAAKRQAFTNSRLIDLNGADAGLLKINDLVTEGKGELLRLQFTADIGTRERPVENGNGTR